MATEGQDAKPAVRFTSENEEIAPEESLEQVQTLTGHENKREREDLGPEAQEELRNLKVTLQKSRQQRRFENFAFEPVSLPASRVSQLRGPAPRVPSCLFVSDMIICDTGSLGELVPSSHPSTLSESVASSVSGYPGDTVTPAYPGCVG